MAFDIDGALKAGYSPAEVTDYLKTAGSPDFDIAGAQKAGYSPDEIVGFLKTAKPAPVSDATNSLLTGAENVKPDETTGVDINSGLGPMRQDYAAKTVQAFKEATPADRAAAVAQGGSTGKLAGMAQDQADNDALASQVMQAPGQAETAMGPQANADTVSTGLGHGFALSAARAWNGLVNMYADATGNTALADEAQRNTRIANQIEAGETPHFDSDYSKMLYSGVSGLVNAAPGLGAAVVNPVAGAAVFAGQAGAEGYGKYRARGGTPGEATVGGGSEAAIMAATSFLPLNFIAKKLGNAGMGEFVTGLVARDVPMMQAQSIANSIVDTSVANPDKTWGEWANELPDTVKQATVSALVFSVAGAAGHGAAKAFAGKDASVAAPAGTSAADQMLAIRPAEAQPAAQAEQAPPIPTPADILAAPDIDTAISAADAATNAPVAVAGAPAVFAGRGAEGVAKDMAYDAMAAQRQQEVAAQRQAEFDRAQGKRLAGETYIADQQRQDQNVAQAAATTRAGGFDDSTETQMQRAFRLAQERKAAAAPANAENAEPEAGKAAPTIADIHAIAESQGIPSDNDPAFAARTTAITGKEHLDDLNPEERQAVAENLVPPIDEHAAQPGDKVVNVRSGPVAAPDPNTLLGAIRALGGIDPSGAADIFKENQAAARARLSPGLIRNGGQSDPSLLAEYLRDRGFSQVTAENLPDMIEQDLTASRKGSGQVRVLNDQAMAEAQDQEEHDRYKDQILKTADRFGIKGKFSTVLPAVTRIAEARRQKAQELLSDRANAVYTRIEDEAMRTIGPEDVDATLSDLSPKFEGRPPYEFLKAATADLKGKIDAVHARNNEDAERAAGRGTGESQEPAGAETRAAGDGTGPPAGQGGVREANRTGELDRGELGGEQRDHAGIHGGAAPEEHQRQKVAGGGENGHRGESGSDSRDRAVRPAIDLEAQTKADLAARQQRLESAEAERQQAEQAAENKRQADAERSTFGLTGSDRPADTLAAQGQGGLFEGADKKKSGGPLFARGDQGAGIDRATFGNSLTDAFGDRAAARLLDSGIITPLDDQSQLPDHVIPYLREGDRIYGFYDPKTDKTYAVLGNLSAADVKSLAIHEVGVHYGFKGMLGDAKYGQVMKRLDILRKGGQADVKAAYAQAKAQAKPEHVPEETLAYLVQNRPDMSLAREVLTSMRAFLFRNFGMFGKSLTVDDMAALARASVLKARLRAQEPEAAPQFARSAAGDESIPDADEMAKAATSKLQEYLKAPKAFMSDLKLMTVPMAEGSDEARVVAKAYANQERLAQWQWRKFDDVLIKNFTEAQREKMWNAADEENDLRREGITDPARGLGRLDPAERKAMDVLHNYGEALMQRAQGAGMFEGEGVPYWTPRMAVMVGDDGSFSRPAATGAGGGSSDGRNISTYASSLQQRKYLTSAETEAAMKARLNDGDKTAVLVRDIRTMPMAMARLERAIAARDLVNQVKALGQATGESLVSTSEGPGFFTLDHPAFKTFKPVESWVKTNEGELVDKDYQVRDGNVVRPDPSTPNGYLPVKSYRVADDGSIERRVTTMEKTPIYIRDDFKGPLKAVMSVKPGAVYTGMMALKSKSMGLIMYSPVIHNAVEWGRALPAMDWKGKMSAGLYTYVTGNRAKNDPAIMRDAIEHGLVPIGGRGAMQDITGIMEDPTLTAGRSWTAKALAAPVALISEHGALNVKKAVDAAGKFWHETLLWHRVGDLQMGLYVSMKNSFINKGVSEYDASTLAAHFANRFAGTLPRESMSEGARQILNLALFSRTFTLGNIGVMKDMIAGLPKDQQAMIRLHSGEIAAKVANSQARKTAVAAFVIDVALSYVGNSLVQDWFKHSKEDQSWSDLLDAYKGRYGVLIDKLKADPMSVMTHPFASLQSLSSTATNEPNKEDRIHIGNEEDGTGIYMRLPTGKIGEEFTKYASPFDEKNGTLSQLRAKESTFLKPVDQLWNNDADSFGKKIYSKDYGLRKNVGNVVSTIIGAQLPTSQLVAAWDLAHGKGDEMDVKKIVGPMAGLTYSKGAPGGPAVGELYDAEANYRDRVAGAMDEAKRALKYGDEDKARQIMEDAGMTPRDINMKIRQNENPESRLSPHALRQFNQRATDEEKARMDQLRGQ